MPSSYKSLPASTKTLGFFSCQMPQVWTASVLSEYVSLILALVQSSFDEGAAGRCMNWFHSSTWSNHPSRGCIWNCHGSFAKRNLEAFKALSHHKALLLESLPFLLQGVALVGIKPIAADVELWEWLELHQHLLLGARNIWNLTALAYLFLWSIVFHPTFDGGKYIPIHITISIIICHNIS